MQCRITTRRGNRCTREAVEGGLGFCWQHASALDKKEEGRWKTRLEGAALVVAASELILKITEIAIQCLNEYFGSGESDQLDAKHHLKRALKIRSHLGTYEEESFIIQARVDWIALSEFALEAAWIKNNADSHPIDPRALQWLERKFNAWYENLDESFKSTLNNQLAALETENENE